MEALRKLKIEQSAWRPLTLILPVLTLHISIVRAYHAGSYLPQNLTLIVAGRSLSPTSLLSTLQATVEPSIVAHNQAHGPRPSGWKRPFVESSTASNPPVISADVRETVEFPEKDESVGEVNVSWVGVPANEFVKALAVEIMSVYLTDSAVSPLYKEFVEIDEPLCTGESPVLRERIPTLTRRPRHFLLLVDREPVHHHRVPLIRPGRGPRVDRCQVQGGSCAPRGRGD